MSKRASFTSVRLTDAAGVAAAVVLSFAAYWIAVLPVVVQREIDAGQRNELAALKVSAEDQRVNRDNADLAIERLRSELSKCEIIPTSVNLLNTRIMELGELATESGLVVETIKGDESKPANKRVQVPIMLIARGPYFSIARFLKDLSVKFRDTAVEKFTIAAERTENQGESGLVQIELSWYAVSEGASEVAGVANP